MCIGVFSLEHPDYALILATNRDEFLARPTAPAHWHAFGAPPPAPPAVLAGRDLQAGGSWFGVNRSGRVALLTNITEPLAKYATTRGSLVAAFLRPSCGGAESDTHQDQAQDQDLDSDAALLATLAPTDTRFAGFNLLLLSPTRSSPAPSSETNTPAPARLSYSARLVTNHGGGGALAVRPLRAGERACGGLSNGVDGCEGEWEKVAHVREALGAVLAAAGEGEGEEGSARAEGGEGEGGESEEEKETALVERLFALLSWHPPQRIAHRSDLRRTVEVVPVPIVVPTSAVPAAAPNPSTIATATAPTPTEPQADPTSTEPQSDQTPAPAPTPAPTSNSTPKPDLGPVPAYYGTRLASVLLVRRDGRALFVERDVWMLFGSAGKGVVERRGRDGQRVFRFVVGDEEGE